MGEGKQGHLFSPNLQHCQWENQGHIAGRWQGWGRPQPPYPMQCFPTAPLTSSYNYWTHCHYPEAHTGGGVEKGLFGPRPFLLALDLFLHVVASSVLCTPLYCVIREHMHMCAHTQHTYTPMVQLSQVQGIWEHTSISQLLFHLTQPRIVVLVPQLL